MIDYMHPMVLLQDNIAYTRNEIFLAQRSLEDYKNKLKEMFEMTILYKELKEKYSIVTLEYIDEDLTEVLCISHSIKSEKLSFNTQEIEEKL